MPRLDRTRGSSDRDQPGRLVPRPAYLKPQSVAGFMP